MLKKYLPPEKNRSDNGKLPVQSYIYIYIYIFIYIYVYILYIYYVNAL